MAATTSKPTDTTNSKPTHTPGQRLAVFAIKNTKGGTIWSRAGTAFINKDGSINVYLDVLPLEGKLHLREPDAKTDAEAPEANRQVA